MTLSTAISFPFRGPHIWPNLGCVLVCFLIPIVGPIVIIGYLIGVERKLIENLAADAPRFDFGKFSFYLKRGVYPFLASLLMGLIFMPLVLIFFGALFGGMFLADQHPLAGLLLILGGTLFYMLSMTVLSVASSPLLLKAGLEEEFKSAFDLRFLLDFLARVGLLSLGYYLLLMLLFLPFAFMVCIPIVGPYAYMAIAVFIQTHVRTQLYLEYMNRGGTPFKLKPESPEPAFPVMLAPPPLHGQPMPQ